MPTFDDDDDDGHDYAFEHDEEDDADVVSDDGSADSDAASSDEDAAEPAGADEASDAAAAAAAAAAAPEAAFSDFGLDDRLLKAVARCGWVKPTPVQAAVIPEVFRGRDVLCRGRTGSGKTGAYCLPVLHALLAAKRAQPASSGVRAVVLLPSRELAQQVTKCLKDLTLYCSKVLHVMDLSGDGVTKQAIAAAAPDVVVGTPARLVAHSASGALDLRGALTHLIVDEADLLFSYGYENDVTALLALLPPIVQTLLMSATLSTEVDRLKQLVLRNPAIVQLAEADLPSEAQLTQHTIHCEPDDKFLIVYALLKLRLLTGKTIVFVNDTDRCYKLKLFLEQFSIKSCVLNAELPLNSRYHIVQQFNKGIYDIIIASDEAVQTTAPSSDAADAKKKKGGKRAKGKDGEYGVSRGIDFQDVRNVLNFDFPRTPAAYVHRVGRTARGLNAGLALSLETHMDRKALQQTRELLGEDTLKPYAFKMEAIEGLRYRARDSLKAVTRFAVVEARRKELADEILHSEKLKAHFEDNPRDLAVLRHDRNLLHPRRIHAHMKHVPDYLLPKGIAPEAVKEVVADPKARKRRGGPLPSQKKKQQLNPLKSFTFSAPPPSA